MPVSGMISPARTFIRVLLPEPLRPMMPMESPWLATKEILLNALVLTAVSPRRRFLRLFTMEVRALVRPGDWFLVR